MNLVSLACLQVQSQHFSQTQQICIHHPKNSYICSPKWYSMYSVPKTWTWTVLHLTSVESPPNSVPSHKKTTVQLLQNFWSKNEADSTRPAPKVSRPAPKVFGKLFVHVDSEASTINTLAASGSNQTCPSCHVSLGPNLPTPNFADDVTVSLFCWYKVSIHKSSGARDHTSILLDSYRYTGWGIHLNVKSIQALLQWKNPIIKLTVREWK